jgi:hypothetical protein
MHETCEGCGYENLSLLCSERQSRFYSGSWPKMYPGWECWFPKGVIPVEDEKSSE